MRRRTTTATFAALLATPALAQGDPLTRPFGEKAFAPLLAPQPPRRIHGDTWLVGFQGLNVALVRTRAGLVLIDAGLPQSVPALEANIRAAGFDVRRIRLILVTEPHADHAGGLAALVRDTGARVVAGPIAAAELRAGRTGRDDPQYAPGNPLVTLPIRARIRLAPDRTHVRLGGTIFTAVATPGHTGGSTSWTWQSCVAGRCRTMVFAASLNPVAEPGFRYTALDRAPNVAAFDRSFRRMAILPCDMLLTSHPNASGGDLKYHALLAGAAPDPFYDPTACRSYAAKYRALLDDRLAKERAGTWKD